MAAEARNYPRYSLQQALVIGQKIADENAGDPMNRLLVADALDIKPASSNFKALLSASRSYGITEGTEKASEISLTAFGAQLMKATGSPRVILLRQALMKASLFKAFFQKFDGNKVPSSEMLRKLLVSDFSVPAERADEAAEMLLENGNFVGIIRQISGSPHVMLEGAADAVVEDLGPESDSEVDEDDDVEEPEVAEVPAGGASSGGEPTQAKPKPIFIGHGKKKGPLEKLEKILTGFQIPFKVAQEEANLGRPIPSKVREIMLECGSAILIFTKDEKFKNDKDEEVWRPSENVGNELGACSFAYEDRIVIFKEQGIVLPTNYSSIGYIEFEENGIEAKTAELLQELIGFGLVKITPTG